MKRHILLVDDDEDDVTEFMAALNKIGLPFKCTWAKSGDQAIKQLAYLVPDIIFLDVSNARYEWVGVPRRNTTDPSFGRYTCSALFKGPSIQL